MKIYTGNGDNGETTDLSGQKLPKNDIRIHLIGTLDELNSYLGLIKAMLLHDETWQFAWKTAGNCIGKTQKCLMRMMAHISDNKNEKNFCAESDVIALEKEIDRMYDCIKNHHELIIPGKNIIEAQIQVARTVARRAERYFFTVDKNKYPLCKIYGVYLNRLSDYLFVLSQQESLINVNFINQITGL